MMSTEGTNYHNGMAWLRPLDQAASAVDAACSPFIYWGRYRSGTSLEVFCHNAKTLVGRVVLHPVKVPYTLIKLTISSLRHLLDTRDKIISIQRSLLSGKVSSDKVADVVMRVGFALSVGAFMQIVAFSAPLSGLGLTVAIGSFCAAFAALPLVVMAAGSSGQAGPKLWECGEHVITTFATTWIYARLLIWLQRWIFQPKVEQGAAALQEHVGSLTPATDTYLTRSGEAAFVYKGRALRDLVHQRPELFEGACAAHMERIRQGTSLGELSNYPATLHQGAAAFGVEAGTLEHIYPRAATFVENGTYYMEGGDGLVPLMYRGSYLDWEHSTLQAGSSVTPAYTVLFALAPAATIGLTMSAAPAPQPPRRS